jgi:hypothetical protein
VVPTFSTSRGEPHVGLAHEISRIRWRTSLAIDETRCGAYVHKHLGTLALGVDKQDEGHEQKKGGPYELQPQAWISAPREHQPCANAEADEAHRGVLEVDRVKVKPPAMEVQEEAPTAERQGRDKPDPEPPPHQFVWDMVRSPQMLQRRLRERVEFLRFLGQR